jgi:hypothetical protein
MTRTTLILLPQVPCDTAFTIYDLFDAIQHAGYDVVQLLKDEPSAHLSPMELQFRCGRKVTCGVTDGWGVNVKGHFEFGPAHNTSFKHSYRLCLSFSSTGL